METYDDNITIIKPYEGEPLEENEYVALMVKGEPTDYSLGAPFFCIERKWLGLEHPSQGGCYISKMLKPHSYPRDTTSVRRGDALVVEVKDLAKCNLVSR